MVRWPRMPQLVLILVGISFLTLAGWPGLLDDHSELRVGLLLGGLALSLLGEILAWRTNEALEARLRSVQPRSLTPEQKAALLSSLSTGEKALVGVCSRLMDGESADFADEIASVFADAGWTLVAPLRSSLNDLPGHLSIFVTGDGLEAPADFICRVLTDVGIDCRYASIAENSIGGTREANTIYVVVGRKK
jgi:hypothetical protein